MTDIDIDVDKSAGDTTSEGSSSGGGGGGGGRRSNVFVSGEYGTKVYPPDTDCEKCKNRAVGVLLIEKTRRREDKMDTGTPLCSQHKKKAKEEQIADWDNWEWRRFVD